MADGFKAKLDLSQVNAGLDKLNTSARESLMRRMLVEAGVTLRDAAKSNAAMAANKEGKATRGLLAASIYLVYEKDKSTATKFQYGISWNSKIAPHGHLIEFGHWRYNKIVNGRPQHSLRAGLTKGKGPQDHEGPGALKTPQWVAARPFLRPTIDSYGNVAISLALARGQREFPKLMQEMAP